MELSDATILIEAVLGGLTNASAIAALISATLKSYSADMSSVNCSSSTDLEDKRAIFNACRDSWAAQLQADMGGAGYIVIKDMHILVELAKTMRPPSTTPIGSKGENIDHKHGELSLNKPKKDAKRWVKHKNTFASATDDQKLKYHLNALLFNFVIETLLECVCFAPDDLLLARVMLNSLLVTEAGAGPQLFHMDMPRIAHDVKHASFSAILSLQDGGVFDVIHGSHNPDKLASMIRPEHVSVKGNKDHAEYKYKGHYTKLPLEENDLVVFHSNLIHRGAANLKNNHLRTHMYISRFLAAGITHSATPKKVAIANEKAKEAELLAEMIIPRVEKGLNKTMAAKLSAVAVFSAKFADATQRLDSSVSGNDLASAGWIGQKKIRVLSEFVPYIWEK